MNDKHDECFNNTFSEAILIEFTSRGIPIDDEVKQRPRRGGPSQAILEERAREAARFLDEQNKPVPPESGAANGDQK